MAVGMAMSHRMAIVMDVRSRMDGDTVRGHRRTAHRMPMRTMQVRVTAAGETRKHHRHSGQQQNPGSSHDQLLSLHTSRAEMPR
jgi:hypothetical protein